MIIKHIKDIPAEPVRAEGAEGARVRVIFGPNDGAPNFAMRQFELEPEGQTPFHHHPFEHEILVQEGRLIMVTENGDMELNPGDAVMVLPNTPHRFRNGSDNVSKFICMVPVEYQK